MQIIIPMSGFGERFRKAGYNIPKPLIKVHDKTIIEYVINLFPKENNFIFICNKDHLKNIKFNMRDILKKISPKSKIVSINPHKLGPVHAILKAKKYIKLDKPTIVNYADFTCYWDYKKFKKFALNKKTNFDGVIPSYKDFHPHTIWNNYYAYLKLNKKNLLEDIREKKPFTKDPVKEFASSGTYFFKNGKMMIQYFEKMIKEKIIVNKEYYVSMAYKPMIKDSKKIAAYNLDHFMQWGTPKDLNEYLYWSNCFIALTKKSKTLKLPGYTIIPMAGKGLRFIKDGYKKPKPIIPVSGKELIFQVLDDLPITTNNILVVRDNNTHNLLLNNKRQILRKNTKIIKLNRNTSGQASTCLIGCRDINNYQPITFAACDNGMIYNEKKFLNFFNDKKIDIIVWGARGYPGAYRQPNMYGWISTYRNSNKIKKISVKKQLKDPYSDPVVLGTFTFKNKQIFTESFRELKKNKKKINNEYYLDSCINEAINLKYNCYYFEVDYYLCWGTPNDLKTFEYWQACFHKWNFHPYKLHKDNRVNLKMISNQFL